MANIITEILNQDISWFVDSKKVTKLDDTSIEYIERCITDGISQGELHISYGSKDQAASGWWHVINWRDIACELRNALLAYANIAGPNQASTKKALKRFDDEWTF